MKINITRLTSSCLSLTTIMMALSTAMRRGPVVVTAFSMATLGTRSSTGARAAVRAAGSRRNMSYWGHRSGGQNLFGRAPSSALARGGIGCITSVRSTATADELEAKLEVTHSAYEVITKDIVSEYGAYCTLYKHKKSGAELLSVSTDDDNKVFGITFRTPPSDSTGVPHILEHSVLCGSRKYKTKDPFVQLLQGSLQTFLNAFTYPDRTCYVVASQNDKDFYNLINVYSDAVFHPRAVSDPMVHAQEGWHLELEEKESPLTYKGVVYNEMKGVYSSPDSLLNRESQRSIFPDNTYGVDSGGDPRVIPELSFEQFADFHAKFYHPANSRIYFSGDDDVYKRLELMDEYLNEFDETPESRVKSQIQWQPKKYDQPIKECKPYPAGADQPGTHMLNVNWLLNDKPLSAFEELTLNILDHLMMGTTQSVLRKALMESGLGESVTGGGLSDELLQATFSVGLKGIQPEKVDEVERLIVDTIEAVVSEGFTVEDIASSMNTIEFQMREFNTGSFPRGLSFMLGSMSKWLYGESPTTALKFEEPLAELKVKIEESGSKVFQDMVKDFMADNKHRSTVEMAPSKTLEEELLKEEQDRLAIIKESLSDDDLQAIIDKTNELKKLQASEDPPESRATIPSLELSDLKREETEYPIAVSENENGSGVTVLRHELGSTSGIAYVNVGIDLSVLPLDDVALLPVFGRLMKEAGAGEYDSVSLSQRIGTNTGGISVGLLTTAVHPEGGDKTVKGGEQMCTKLYLQGKSTSDKTGELFSLMRLMLTESRLDSQTKVVEMLRESRSRLESMVQSSGHSVINNRMKARYRVAGYIDEITSGITYLDTVKSLLIQAEEDWPSLLARLENIRSTLLENESVRSGMFVDITADAKVMESVQPIVESFLEDLPGDATGPKMYNFRKDIHPWVPEAKKLMSEMVPIKDEGFVVPTQVSYVGKAGLLFDEGEEVPGSAEVVARHMRTGYLWDYVRVMGGAYGGFCTFSSFSGFFSFLSYRDPNLDKTIDVYDRAADALLATADALEKDPDALATAIIGTIGDKDGALSPDQKGFASLQRWLVNESAEYRQGKRDEILDTKASDFRAFAERLKQLKDPSVAVVSSKAAFEAAAKAGKTMELKEIL